MAIVKRKRTSKEGKNQLQYSGKLGSQALAGEQKDVWTKDTGPSLRSGAGQWGGGAETGRMWGGVAGDNAEAEAKYCQHFTRIREIKKLDVILRGDKEQVNNFWR